MFIKVLDCYYWYFNQINFFASKLNVPYLMKMCFTLSQKIKRINRSLTFGYLDPKI